MVKVIAHEEQGCDVSVVVPTSPVLAVEVAVNETVKGERGYSAYEIWVMQGGVGSEDYFLESLKGDSGDDYILTEQDKKDISDLVEVAGATQEYVDTQDEKTLFDAKSFTEEEIAKIPTPDVSGQIADHNISVDAHNDIRQRVIQEAMSRESADNTLQGFIDDKVGLPTYNATTYELTFTTHNGAKTVIDLPIEQIGLTYDPNTKEMVFVNAEGQTQRISLADFVDIYMGSISDEMQITVENNIIRGELLQGSVGASKLTTALSNLINGKQEALTVQQLENIASVPLKADKESTTSTLQELRNEIKLPKDLIAPAIDEINHFRTISKYGQSQKATPAQVREMVGVDYSKLEEQIVPGEYWRGTDGKPKQVYVRTFTGTIPATANDRMQGLIVKPVDSVKYEQTIYLCGGIISDDQYAIPLNTHPDTYWKVGGSGLGFWILSQIPTPSSWAYFGKRYSITILYTKA